MNADDQNDDQTGNSINDQQQPLLDPPGKDKGKPNWLFTIASKVASACRRTYDSIKRAITYDRFKTAIEKVGFTASNIGGQLNFPQLDIVDRVLPWFSPFTTMVRACLNIYRVVRTIRYSDKSKPRIIAKIALPAIGIGIAIVSVAVAASVIYLAAPVLMIMGAARSFSETCFRIGASIFDYFFGNGKRLKAQNKALEIKIMTDHLNHKNSLNPLNPDIQLLATNTNMLSRMKRKIVNRTISGCINLLAFIGAILCFTPAAPVGLGLIGGASAYNFLDDLNLNPFRRAAQLANKISKKIRNKPLYTDPFRERTAMDMVNSLKKRYSITETVRNNDTSGEQKNIGKTDTAKFSGILSMASSVSSMIPDKPAPAIKKSGQAAAVSKESIFTHKDGDEQEAAPVLENKSDEGEGEGEKPPTP